MEGGAIDDLSVFILGSWEIQSIITEVGGIWRENEIEVHTVRLFLSCFLQDWECNIQGVK